MVRFFGFTFPVFPLKSKNPTVLHVFTSFVLQVRVILLDSLTWFHKYFKESLSVTYVTKWNSYSIFQTDTGYSVVFFYNAAQGKNSEIRMFLGTPCLPAKMTPAQHSYLVDVFQWWTEFVLLLVAVVLSLPSTVDSCCFLFFCFCHLFDPPEQSSPSEIKLTKKFSSLVQLPEMNGLVKRFSKCRGVRN